jgi:hypothetical protein
MSSTKDLINAISTGDSVGIETAFNTAMAEKITVQLDAMRQEVAQNMFKSAPMEAAPEASAE